MEHVAVTKESIGKRVAQVLLAISPFPFSYLAIYLLLNESPFDFEDLFEAFDNITHFLHLPDFINLLLILLIPLVIIPGLIGFAFRKKTLALRRQKIAFGALSALLTIATTSTVMWLDSDDSSATPPIAIPLAEQSQTNPFSAIQAADPMSIEGRLGLSFVSVPPGEFAFGSNDPKFPESNPSKTFWMNGFEMSAFETTLGQFMVFVNEANRTDLVTKTFKLHNDFGDNAPVVWVSRKDINDYITWLNSQSGFTYRLPSEAEWEYACLAGSNTQYCGGEDPDAIAWNKRNSKRRMSVGTKLPNAWGFFDMTGNASELVEDCWHKTLNGGPTDQTPWREPKCYANPLRGGSSGHYGSEGNIDDIMRAKARWDWPTAMKADTVGFRLVRTK